MVMNTPLQIASISRELERRGISPDTVDVSALIDPTLSLPENKELILSQFAGTEAGNIRQSKGLDEQMGAQFCEYVDEECIRGDKEACKAACNECGTHCEPQIVQVQNRKTREYVKIDTRKGEIVSRRKERYKGVPQVRKKKPIFRDTRKIKTKHKKPITKKTKSTRVKHIPEVNIEMRLSKLESRVEVIEKKIGGTKGMETKKKQHCKNTKVKSHTRKPRKCKCPRNKKGQFAKKRGRW